MTPPCYQCDMCGAYPQPVWHCATTHEGMRYSRQRWRNAINEDREACPNLEQHLHFFCSCGFVWETEIYMFLSLSMPVRERVTGEDE